MVAEIEYQHVEFGQQVPPVRIVGVGRKAVAVRDQQAHAVRIAVAAHANARAVLERNLERSVLGVGISNCIVLLRSRISLSHRTIKGIGSHRGGNPQRLGRAASQSDWLRVYEDAAVARSTLPATRVSGFREDGPVLPIAMVTISAIRWAR